MSGSKYTNNFNEKHLLFIIIIQFSLAFIQNVLCNIGYSSFIESFGTHPSKINEGEYYNISQWFPGFFRVHGGFKESSQFAVFCCLLLFITKSKIIHLISILSIFLTGSISGFLGLLFFCLYKLKFLYLRILISVLTIIILIPLFRWRITHSSVFNRNAESMDSDRFLGCTIHSQVRILQFLVMG